ncbi:TPA: hypothetical protein ACQCV3_001436 [Campylobacter coli]
MISEEVKKSERYLKELEKAKKDNYLIDFLINELVKEYPEIELEIIEAFENGINDKLSIFNKLSPSERIEIRAGLYIKILVLVMNIIDEKHIKKIEEAENRLKTYNKALELSKNEQVEYLYVTKDNKENKEQILKNINIECENIKKCLSFIHEGITNGKGYLIYGMGNILYEIGHKKNYFYNKEEHLFKKNKYINEGIIFLLCSLYCYEYLLSWNKTPKTSNNDFDDFMFKMQEKYKLNKREIKRKELKNAIKKAFDNINYIKISEIIQKDKNNF